MAHTPGPWKVHHHTTDNGMRIVTADDTQVISMAWARLVDKSLPEWQQAQANARLIAAAPELLAELEVELAFLDSIWIRLPKDARDRVDERKSQIEQALARAEAQGSGE